MWELIRANQRKSIILFSALATCLLVLGYLIGAAVNPQEGGVSGMFIAAIIWLIMSGISLTSGDSIFLSIANAKPVTHDVHPMLFNVTEEMRIAANLPVQPKLYIMHQRAPNAFATGRSVNNSAIVVTSGLLEQLNRDELQGVIAHEMAHILNRDVRFITLAGILLGSIVLISEVFIRGMFYSGRSRRYSSRSDSSSGGQAQAIFAVIAILFAILAPILAQILYFSISRKREYLADATAARLTRYPEGLASALEKISRSSDDLTVANKVTAPMYIINPLKPKGRALNNLTSTHPPINERIKILRSMMHGIGANFDSYQTAFAKVRGDKGKIIPESGLKDKEAINIRRPAAEPQSKTSKKQQFRNIGDLVRAANGFAFLTCACGLKIKIPPEYNKDHVNCPKCKTHLELPMAETAVMGAALDQALGPQKPQMSQQPSESLKYKRKSRSWESLKCQCGHVMSISPLFAGTQMRCSKCKRTIEIE